MASATETASAIMGLLGGATFRLAVGFALDRAKEWQDHITEVRFLKVQDGLEDSRQKRQNEAIKLQKDLGVEVVPVEATYPGVSFDQSMFANAVESVKQKTGFRIVDIVNSAIRPGLAIVCILVWLGYLYNRNFVLGAWDLELISATLGIFIGSRISSTGR